MRIFTAVRHANDPAQFYGSLWSTNFHPALRDLGHEIVTSQTDLAPTSGFMGVGSGYTREELDVRARTTEQILDEVRAAHRVSPIDLFLCYFYNAHFDPAGFDELRRLGIRTINFFCNSIYQFELVAAIAAKVDVSWHAERDARARYLAVGARPVWVQMGADPGVYHPVASARRQASACFVGQRYADRDLWMAALIRAGLPVDIFGSGWGAPEPSRSAVSLARSYLGRPTPRPGTAAAYMAATRAVLMHEGVVAGFRRLGRVAAVKLAARRAAALCAPNAKGPVPLGGVADVFSRYELCLNFSNVWADGRPGSALIPHVRLRDFEAPMCRTCYLTGHTDEIEDFYSVGREIDTYRSSEELVDKSRFYLTHPAQAERLRDAGYRRALRDHTWSQRFQQLFRQTGLSA